MSWDKEFTVIRDYLDEGIREAVGILMANGVDTFESCEGKSEGRYHGKEHCFPEPTIRFHGDTFECIRVLDICEQNKLNAYECKYCFRRVDGVLDKPFCEVIFLRHQETGTIFLP